MDFMVRGGIIGVSLSKPHTRVTSLHLLAWTDHLPQIFNQRKFHVHVHNINLLRVPVYIWPLPEMICTPTMIESWPFTPMLQPGSSPFLLLKTQSISQNQQIQTDGRCISIEALINDRNLAYDFSVKLSDSYLVTASCINTLTFPDLKHETHP